ncbi:sensor histidine kinase [Armatimonas sp.]|uniref:sensor histidine kinase n=1 Tax=Armatimonas sp. TaxID=1872638 RepID=UPI00374D6F9D
MTTRRSNILRRVAWPLAISAVYFVVSWLLLTPFPGETKPNAQFRNGLINSLGDVLGLIWCLTGLWTIYRSPAKSKTSFFWPPLFLGLSCFFRAIADTIWAWLEWKSVAPFPSLADPFFLLVIPAILLGVLLLPTRRLDTSQRIRVLLDSLVGLTALFIFSWRLLISPTILSSAAMSPLAKTISLAYPIGDLLLAGCLIMLTVRSGRVLRGAGLGYLALGITALLIADCFFLYLNLQDSYVTGTPLDLLWPLSSLCLGLGGRCVALESLVLKNTSTNTASSLNSHESPLRTAVPYLLVPLAGVFFFTTILEYQRPTLEVIGMCVSGALLIALILLRQFVALRENWQMVRRIKDDATVLKQLNAELQATQAELVHSAKMASLGTLSAGVAHELNQPIAIIRGLSQQLQDEPDLSKFMIEDLEQIETQTSRMMRIINHMRTFCRTTGHSTSVICLKQLIEDCLILIAAQLHSHGITLSVHTETDKTTVKVNANEIEQVLLNLLTNARDALRETPDATLDIRLRETNGQVVLECADNGPGIPPEILPRLFEPFFTTKEVGQGMGLGLSISTNLVKSNGGTLSARNERGAVFTLRLPYAPAETEEHLGHARPELKKAA